MWPGKIEDAEVDSDVIEDVSVSSDPDVVPCLLTPGS